VAELLSSFIFQVSLVRSSGEEGAQDPNEIDDDEDRILLGDGGFQECTGLEIEQDIKELYEGGRNEGVIRQVGRAKYQNIVLKRGMIIDAFDQSGGSSAEVRREFWDWLRGVVGGKRPVLRYDGIIEVHQGRFDPNDPRVVARWEFDRGLPAKIVGPQLNAKTGEIAIEELHIAHEGLRLVSPR
jgi:phage tail-like protein